MNSMAGLSFFYFYGNRVNSTLTNFYVNNITFTQGRSLVNILSSTVAEVPGQITGVTVANWTLQNIYDTSAIVLPALNNGIISVTGTTSLTYSNITANNLQLQSKNSSLCFFD